MVVTVVLWWLLWKWKLLMSRQSLEILLFMVLAGLSAVQFFLVLVIWVGTHNLCLTLARAADGQSLLNNLSCAKVHFFNLCNPLSCWVLNAKEEFIWCFDNVLLSKWWINRWINWLERLYQNIDLFEKVGL